MKEKSDKLLLGIFVFLISWFFATWVHELGHFIALFFVGCTMAMFWINMISAGYTECISNENFWHELSNNQAIFATYSTFILLFLVGTLMFFLYRYSNFIKQRPSLSIIFYFLTFSTLTNGFLQLLSGGDQYYLLTLGFNSVYSYFFALFFGIFIFLHIKSFKKFLARVEPKIDKKSAKILRVIFSIIVVLIYAGWISYSLFF